VYAGGEIAKPSGNYLALEVVVVVVDVVVLDDDADGFSAGVF
jgi:hypothetical protein